MIVYFNLYLRKLEQEILNSEFIETLDPILIKEFKKAINSITPEYWAKIENLFKETLTMSTLLMNKWLLVLLQANLV